jgi:outer membrane lipoprotein-sorting protein
MSYLRHISTRRLLALCAATVVVLAGSAAAIALAAGGSGPTPPPKRLAQAVHDAVAAAPVDGVTARISFTNHLIDAASLQGSDPLLTGAKGRLWATPDKVRLELQASSADGRGGDVQVLLDGDQLTIIETGSNTVYKAKLPQDHQKNANEPVPSLARIQDALTHLSEKATLSGAQPSDVAGRPAYTVRISPRHDGGLLGGAEVAWDAEHGVPLRAAVYANGAADPVLELKATDISFGKVAASDLAIPEPAGAHVVDLNPSSSAGGGGTDRHADVTGLAAVQAKVGFTIVAPDALVGLPRKDVKLVDLDGTPAALVTYGQGLGGIAVLESPSKAQPQTQQKGGRDGGGGLSLPKISINGASGQELDTALGTVVRFDRAGIGYVVAGSVPPTAAEAAARGL